MKCPICGKEPIPFTRCLYGLHWVSFYGDATEYRNEVKQHLKGIPKTGD